MNKKAVALLSGGLDSTLAIALILKQGIEVEALNFRTIFCTCTSRGSCQSEANKVSKQLGIKLKTCVLKEEYLEMIRKAKYGYGSGINPCIDCRIMMFKKAREYMIQTGASFVITGEVLGERPMSQRRSAIEIIERESGLEGLIVRPLSAKNFPFSQPEKEGIVDRNKLFDISGRSRKLQIALAKELDISDYPCPAGGCLLTDKNFAAKLRDFFQHESNSFKDIILLKIGRHFRLAPQCKAIVGRNKEEDEKLRDLAKVEDYLFELADYAGPLLLLQGKDGKEVIDKAAGLVQRFSKKRDEERVKIRYYTKNNQKCFFIFPPKLSEEEVKELKIAAENGN